jgi:hypothetical protein
MPTINGTNFNGNGKFHKCLVRAIALVSLSFIEFSLGTVITAPALALQPSDWCFVLPELPWCPPGGGGGDGGFEPPAEPNPKPPYDPDDPKPKPPNPPKPQPPNQPKPDPSVCTKKPDLPQCN